MDGVGRKKSPRGGNLSGGWQEREQNKKNVSRTISIEDNPAKVHSISENLLEFSSAARYALSRGERYAALPMRAEDADAFEAVAEFLEYLIWRCHNGQVGAFYDLVERVPIDQPVRHAVRGALVRFCAARKSAGLSTDEADREHYAALLYESGDDPEVWVTILGSWSRRLEKN